MIVKNTLPRQLASWTRDSIRLLSLQFRQTVSIVEETSVEGHLHARDNAVCSAGHMNMTRETCPNVESEETDLEERLLPNVLYVLLIP